MRFCFGGNFVPWTEPCLTIFFALVFETLFDGLCPPGWSAMISSMDALFIHSPKSGGCTIREMFEGKFRYKSHTPASVWKSELGDAFDDLWKFAFIRNPWDRMVSWYCVREMRHLGNRPKPTFGEWMLDSKNYRILYDRFEPRGLLCDKGGNLLIDTIYRFEEFEASVELIKGVLGVEAETIHSNRNEKRPAADYQTYYTPESVDVVARLSAWEIETFGYTFDG